MGFLTKVNKYVNLFSRETGIRSNTILKKLVDTEDLCEIRVISGGNNDRFLGFNDGTKLLILTNGFSKKKQNIPDREIELAQRRRKEYIQRRMEK